MLISTNVRPHLSTNDSKTNMVRSTALTNLIDRNICLDSSRSSSANSKNIQLNNTFNESLLISNEFISSKAKYHSRSKNLNRTSLILNESKNCTNSNLKEQLSEENIIKILNNFVFLLFLIFIVALHLISLIILPYFIKTPLSIED